MAQEDAVSKAVSGAKSELAKANKLSSEADPTSAQKPKAPVTPVAPTKPAVSPKVGSGLGAELGEKARNVTEYTNSVPKMHKGGEIKGDGLHVVNLEKGEKVKVEPKEEAMAEKPAKKSSPEALMTSEDKGPKKEAKAGKKDAKGKGGEFVETRIHHHNAGGHHTHHVHRDDPKKDIHYASQDLEGVKQGLDNHIGGGAGQVMDAAEPPMPAGGAEPAPQAAPPAAAMPQQV